MKSKTKLFEDLALIALVRDDMAAFCNVADKGQGLKHRHIGNETYGKKSIVYVQTGSSVARRALENLLETKGHKVDREYWPKSTVVAVQVSYFKGWHWDE